MGWYHTKPAISCGSQTEQGTLGLLIHAVRIGAILREGLEQQCLVSAGVRE